MFHIEQNIKNGAYMSFLEYALEFCDIATLLVRNHNKIVIDSYNQRIMPEYEIGYCEELNDPSEAVFYENACRFVERIFEGDIVKAYYTSRYFTTLSGDEKKVYHIRFTEKTVRGLWDAESFFAWRYPFLPEDLCLFSKGKYWLINLAHERELLIYDERPETRALLQKFNIQFSEWSMDPKNIRGLNDFGGYDTPK